MKNWILIFLVLAGSTANAEFAPSHGVNGEISLSTGYLSSTTNFDVENESTISSLENSAERKTQYFAFPIGNIAYTFGEALDRQIYFGTTREDISVGALAVQLGYKHQLSSGTVVDVSFLPTVISGDTWQNPYELNTPRKKTDVTGNAYRLQLNSINSSDFSLDLAFATSNVKDDLTARSDLARDADTYYAKGSYRFTVSPTSFISPSVIYVRHNAEGSASSYNAYGAEVNWFNIRGRHGFVLTAKCTTLDYDSASTLFNSKRSDDEFSLFAAYEYAQFLGWKDWSFISFAGYGDTQSNLTFYDESSHLFAVGLNYKF